MADTKADVKIASLGSEPVNTTHSKDFESRSDVPNGESNVSSSNRSGRQGGESFGRDQRRSRNNRGQGSRVRNGEKGGKRQRDIGRADWRRNPVNKRNQNDEQQASKRQKMEFEGLDPSSLLHGQEGITSEERKPKRKVAVLIGYAGSGYKGMQINATEKTIEGDLFSAFVTAGAISKANADDPKKSSLVRCARTDKGVHAAGNVISLKLIVEDPDIVAKINEALPSQIRVWGIERTNGSFSCYQTCDSRWYEYLIPTYSFLPPHPQSFLGKQLVESAEKEDVFERYQTQQEDVAHFWAQAEKTYVIPIIEKLDLETREAVVEAFHSSEVNSNVLDLKAASGGDGPKPTVNKLDDWAISSPNLTAKEATLNLVQNVEDTPLVTSSVTTTSRSLTMSKSVLSPTENAIKEVKAAYIKAKKAYRISDTRRERVQNALLTYLGTRNFHNYTIQKTFRDPSAKRVIRSFRVGSGPIIINDTEWLSLKVHGQSFMMHQIRKMVAMVALVVRTGCPLERITESYGPDNISIPKAPGLGLLLERPVFDSYNERAVTELHREKIDFDKFGNDIQEFKQREIYERIFREEEKDHQFHTFFHHIDHYRTDDFLWVTASGIPAARRSLKKGEMGSRASKVIEGDSADEAEDGDGEG